MTTLLHGLIGREVAVFSDAGSGQHGDNQYRDVGLLEAFDGVILRLQKPGNELLYLPIYNIQRVTCEAHNPPLYHIPDTDTAPAGLLTALVQQPVSVWLSITAYRTDGVLEAFDAATVRLRTNELITCFPLVNVRLLKRRE